MAGITLLLSATSAIAGNIAIEAGNRGIKGYADQAPLGEVLGRLADQTGCEIFIDEKLYDTPVTFNLPSPVPSEQAIRRIVHPYSNAMVYEAVPGTDQIRIQQIKVFDKGGQVSRYVHAAANRQSNLRDSYARGSGTTRQSSLLSGRGVSAGPQAAKQRVRPALSVEKGALGLPSFNYGGKGQGADRRSSMSAMRKAYTKYRQESQAYNERNAQSAMLDGRRKSIQAQTRYRSQRLQAIKNRIETNY